MKQCTKCKEIKPQTEFRKCAKTKDGLHYLCKSCHKEYDKEWYRINPERKKSIRENNKKTNKQNQKFVYEFLLNHHCVDCGEQDPIVLEFDHFRDKKYNISDMLQNACSEQALLTEINKCEIRCANCHRKKLQKNLDGIKHYNHLIIEQIGSSTLLIGSN